MNQQKLIKIILNKDNNNYVYDFFTKSIDELRNSNTPQGEYFCPWIIGMIIGEIFDENEIFYQTWSNDDEPKEKYLKRTKENRDKCKAETGFIYYFSNIEDGIHIGFYKNGMDNFIKNCGMNTWKKLIELIKIVHKIF